MKKIEEFPEVIRRQEGTKGKYEDFLFWLETAGKGRILMLASENSFSEADANTEVTEPLPVYRPLYSEETCIRIEFS